MTATAAQFADWAVAFDARLRDLAWDVDAGWRELMAPWAFIDALPEEQSRGLWPRLWSGHLREAGGLPTLRELADPLVRLCLLPRETLMPQLCALALARRPGVLRCCVDREARAPLRAALGERFGALSAMGASGRPVDAATAARSPDHWSCVGYLDWSASLSAESRGVRRIVELCLPRAVLDGLRDAPPEPAERDLPRAVAALEQAGVAWPC